MPAISCGCAHPAERHRPQRVGDRPPRASPGRLHDPVDPLSRHVRLHPARADRVHLHVGGRELGGERAYEPEQTRPSRRCKPCSRGRRSWRGSTRSRRRAGQRDRARGAGRRRGCTSRCRRDSSPRSHRSGRRDRRHSRRRHRCWRRAPVNGSPRRGGRAEGSVDTCPRSDVAQKWASPPTCAATCSSSSRFGASSESDAPSAASRSAIALPIPRPPPVTTTCRPVSATIPLLLSLFA